MIEENLCSIIDRVIQGKTQDFQQIVEQYEKLVFKILYTRLPHYLRWAAEDLAQEIFLTVFENLNRFRCGTSFINWIYTITARRCANFIKKESRRTHEALYETLACEEKKDLQGEEILTALRDAVAVLPEKYQKVLFFYYAEDKKIHEIGAILGVSENTVKTWLKRSKEKLSKQKKLQHFNETFSA